MIYKEKLYILKYKQMYALIKKYDRILSHLHDEKYESIKIIKNYVINFIIDVEFINIKSNFSTQLKFVKRNKKAIFNQLKTENENVLNVIIVNDNKKIISKFKFIH